MADLEQRRVIHGIDLSAAADAGTRIWITTGQVAGQALRITGCRPAALLDGSGAERNQCLPALRRFIREQRFALLGIDFPGSPHISGELALLDLHRRRF